MQKIYRFKMLPFFLVAAYLLAACGGTLPGSALSAGSSKVEANPVAFTGVVEAINGAEWTVSGQKLTLDPQVSLDPNIKVGDEIRVEANVLANGTVVALKLESSTKDDAVSTSFVDASSTPDPVSIAVPAMSASLEASSTPDPTVLQGASTNAGEIFGAVEAVTADTITVSGVTYSLANFTEFKDKISVGDQVKVHVIANADGTFTVREIEKSQASFEDNSNSAGADDGPNHDVNDDHSDHSSNDNSQHSSDDHGNDSSPDDNGGSSNSGSGDG